MDVIDRRIINHLQQGFPICERPYAQVAEQLEISEAQLLQRLQQLLDDKVLSRFGPMYHAERMGGGLTLAAMSVPWIELDKVAEQINALSQVAHNYARDHLLNMWFVVATESATEVNAVIQRIEDITGYPVYNMPKIEEFYVGLKLDV